MQSTTMYMIYLSIYVHGKHINMHTHVSKCSIVTVRMRVVISVKISHSETHSKVTTTITEYTENIQTCRLLIRGGVKE